MNRKILFILVVIALAALTLMAAKKNGIVGYYAFPGGGPSWGGVFLNGEFTVIQDLALPAGDYIANATPSVAMNGTGEIFSVSCIFTLNGTILGELSTGMIGENLNDFLTLPLTAGFTLTRPGELAVACRSDAPGVFSQPTSITAIRVDNLIIQGGFEP